MHNSDEVVEMNPKQILRPFVLIVGHQVECSVIIFIIYYFITFNLTIQVALYSFPLRVDVLEQSR